MSQENRPLRLVLLTQGDPGRLTGGYLYQQRMAAGAALHDARLQVVPVGERILPLQALAVGRVLAGVHADALLVDSIVAAAAGRAVASARPRIPVIAVVHQQPGGVDASIPLRALRRSLDLALYRRAGRVIAVSDWLRDKLVREGVSQERIVVVPPGREPPGRFLAPAPDLRRGRRAALICVSNWVRNKRIDLALDAVARLPPVMATLHLVGDENADRRYAAQLRRRIGRDDLRDRVVVHGRLPPQEVAGLLAGADLLVHPSRHESYGQAVAEGMTAGVPVVAFAIDNLPYLVRDGLDGKLVAFGDVSAMASAIAELILDGDRRETMRANARSRAAGFPTWADSADRFFAAIRSAEPG